MKLFTTTIPSTKTMPKITIVHPAAAKCSPNTSLLIYPGGGYRRCVDTIEGLAVGRFFARQGILCFVVHYRIGKFGKCSIRAKDANVSIQDGIQSLNWLRTQQIISIDLTQINLMGFSAGGHLALSILKNDFKHNNEENEHQHQHQSKDLKLFPNVASVLLMYPTLRNPCCWCITGGIWFPDVTNSQQWPRNNPTDQHYHCYATTLALHDLVLSLNTIPVFIATSAADLLLPTYKNGGKLALALKSFRTSFTQPGLQHVHSAVPPLIGPSHGHGLHSYWVQKAVVFIQKHNNIKIKNTKTAEPTGSNSTNLQDITDMKREKEKTMKTCSWHCVVLLPVVALVVWKTMVYCNVGCWLGSKWVNMDRSWMKETEKKENSFLLATFWYRNVPKCPCMKDQIEDSDLFVADKIPLLHQPCHGNQHVSERPGCTKYSYRTKDSTLEGYGNQCCYDVDEKLITSGLSQGTVDRYAPITLWSTMGHVVHDVVPFILCCHLCTKDCVVCDLYTKERRPLVGVDGCEEVKSDYL